MTAGWLRQALDRKRRGEALAPETWEHVVAGYLDGSIEEAAVAALLMAAAIRGLDAAETEALSAAMIRSGDTIAFDRPVVDKHSTGGVGDSVSLIVVPLVAACGVPVAKLSGRALGHTGGTIDKLISIPGVQATLAPAAFRAQVDRIGCAIGAQSPELVPADGRLYDLRDRTGTVASVGLIAASIVSKKVAGGARAIVFDVKTGRGAFMATLEEARRLAEMLVHVAARLGRRSSALITDMDEPLGPSIGNALEAIEAREFLAGRARDSRLDEVVRLVAAEMLRVGGAGGDVEARIAEALASGRAYERFVALIEAQGGSRATFEAMRAARPQTTVRASRAGYVGAVDAVALGELARAATERCGSDAGIVVRARVGDRVAAGAPLADVVLDEGSAPAAGAAFTIAERPPAPRPLLYAVVREAELAAASKGAR